MGGMIYILRHGATKLNNQTDMSEDRIRGWTDVPLAESGRKEAQAAALKLKAKGVNAIVTSDLSRARETAAIIGKALGVVPAVSRGLRPWNLGTFAGKATKDAMPKIADYAQKRPDEAVPEGESFNQFKERAFSGLADAIDANQGKVLVIVTHHRNERLYEAWEKAGRPEDLSIDLPTFLQKGDPPGGIKELAIGDVSQWEPQSQSDAKVHRTNSSSGPMRTKTLIKADTSGINISDGASPARSSPIRSASPAGKNGPNMPNPSDNPSFYVNMDESPGEQSQVRRSQNPSDPKAKLLAHGRAIAGAKALHAAGHITAAERDKHIAISRSAIAKAALFGKR